MDIAGGRLVFILASRDVQTAAELAAASDLSLAETVSRLQELLAHGFVVASDTAGEPVVYRLAPKSEPLTALDPQQRILVVDDSAAILEVVAAVLEDEGYGVLAAGTQAEATALLEQVAFDLVITDGFSTEPAGALVGSADVLQAAGATPVALFSAHRIELAAAQAAGFRDLIAKPFDVATLAQQVRVLLGS